MITNKYLNGLKAGILLGILMLVSLCLTAQEIGKPFPHWQKGLMDIHHINTGKGECALFMLPDGTTMLVDAGVHTRKMDENAAKAVPDDSRQPGEWIARYIQKVLKPARIKKLDYVVLTHFDTDHIGGILPGLKTGKGGYFLTGVSEVLEYIPASKIIDRNWPDYNWPKPLTQDHIANYRRFVEWQVKNNNVQAEQFKVGSQQQISLLKEPGSYLAFQIRNLVANGVVWTGKGEETENHYPAVESLTSHFPSENGSSIGFRLTYGLFDYFTGGDLIGVPSKNSPAWHDIETPVARVTGPVDVHVLNHHGYVDAQNAFFLSVLQPRVSILQAWDSYHPAPDPLDRIMSEEIYEGPRDLFATNLIDTARQRLGDKVNKIASQQGHVVVRVADGGASYMVFVLDDTNEKQLVKAKFGPYMSK